MIFNKPGEVYEHEGVQYTIGMTFRTSDNSDYRGLSGIVWEIRDKEDMETDNLEPDLYCTLFPPESPVEREKMEKHFSALYRMPKKLEEIPLDMVILAPCEICSTDQSPPCFTPEPDNPYPLCVGNGSDICWECCLFMNMKGEGGYVL